jgi:hypothetical protein
VIIGDGNRLLWKEGFENFDTSAVLASGAAVFREISCTLQPLKEKNAWTLTVWLQIREWMSRFLGLEGNLQVKAVGNAADFLYWFI